MNYTADLQSLEGKREELVAIAFSVLRDTSLAEQVVRSLCRLSPPKDPPCVMEMITLHSQGASGGLSRKPGNILVNFRDLVSDFGDISMHVAAGAIDRRLIPLAALAIWSKVWSRSKIELRQEQASLLYSMWVNRQEGKLISREEAYEMGRLVFRNHRLTELDDETFDSLLSDLVSFGCIGWHESGKILLREWVKNNYS